MPPALAYAVSPLFEAAAALTRRPPLVSRRLLHVAHRYSWYDAGKARTHLGWTPRPFAETVADTVAWFRDAACRMRDG